MPEEAPDVPRPRDIPVIDTLIGFRDTHQMDVASIKTEWKTHPAEYIFKEIPDEIGAGEDRLVQVLHLLALPEEGHESRHGAAQGRARHDKAMSLQGERAIDRKAEVPARGRCCDLAQAVDHVEPEVLDAVPGCGGAVADRRVVNRCAGNQNADLLFNRAQAFRRRQVALRDREDCVPHAEQMDDIQMLLGLGHHAVVGRDGKDNQVDELKKLVKLYDKYKKLNILKDEKLSECKENAQLTTVELAKVWHNEALKTLNLDTLGYSEALYRLYVEYFGDAPDVGEVEYYLAD